MIKYGIRIGKKIAVIHVGEFKPSKPGASYGHVGSVWFGSSDDICDSEDDAKVEVDRRLRDAVRVHKDRLESAKDRLTRFEVEGHVLKRHS